MAAILDGFLQKLVLHGLFTQQTLQLFDLFCCCREFGGRNDILASHDRGQAAFLILLAPGEDLIGIHAMKPGDMRYRHARLKRFLDNGNFFLWRTTPAALRSE
ncbi:hypothetical protein NG99_02990 [Erwinia typographi]|uniref:Uncharacterized protein n=1 Tax=Erwinia typographi TaxID=371042 RepID=A0A0A3ZD51_9GAMM|nr:hypothetical protein NG99_02990 [Erwinia typographi]